MNYFSAKSVSKTQVLSEYFEFLNFFTIDLYNNQMKQMNGKLST